MLKQFAMSLEVALIVLSASSICNNSIAEAGYFLSGDVDVEIDDSSVYRVGEKHVRVVYYIIMNRHTRSMIVDTAEVNWGNNPYVVLNKASIFESDFVQELKLNLLKYCLNNY